MDLAILPGRLHPGVRVRLAAGPPFSRSLAIVCLYATGPFAVSATERTVRMIIGSKGLWPHWSSPNTYRAPSAETATYWRPSTAYEIGPLAMFPPRLTRQSSSPVRASSA